MRNSKLVDVITSLPYIFENEKKQEELLLSFIIQRTSIGRATCPTQRI